MIDFIGWVGVVLYLVAYALLGFGWLKAGIRYHSLNAAGGLCLVIFSYHLHARPNFVVNFVWILLATVSVARIVIIRKRERRASKPEQ